MTARQKVVNSPEYRALFDLMMSNVEASAAACRRGDSDAAVMWAGLADEAKQTMAAMRDEVTR